MGIISRIGNAPGARKLVRKQQRPGEVRENDDDTDLEPTWCAGCRREVLFGLSTCPDCGGKPMTALELSRHEGDLPPAGSASPTGWRPPSSAPTPQESSGDPRLPHADA